MTTIAADPPIAAPAPSPVFMELDLPTSDGAVIAARYYEASRRPARGGVLIVPAMGVPQSYYSAFATWLAGEGFDAVTFDYRGMGKSRRGPLSKVDADILTWAKEDTAAALHKLQELTGDRPITWIGHSLGGQIVPLVDGHPRLARIITVAAGNGYWRENSPQLKRKVWLFWWFAVPVLTPLFGYFPGRAIGMVGDLPRNVVRQWKRWCMHPEYAIGVEGPALRERFAEVTVPITSFSFTDDEMMSEKNTASLHAFYTAAPKTMHRFHPADLGVKRVGHFGFFRAAFKQALWEKQLRHALAAG